MSSTLSCCNFPFLFTGGATTTTTSGGFQVPLLPVPVTLAAPSAAEQRHVAPSLLRPAPVRPASATPAPPFISTVTPTTLTPKAPVAPSFPGVGWSGVAAPGSQDDKVPETKEERLKRLRENLRRLRHQRPLLGNAPSNATPSSGTTLPSGISSAAARILTSSSVEKPYCAALQPFLRKPGRSVTTPRVTRGNRTGVFEGYGAQRRAAAAQGQIELTTAASLVSHGNVEQAMKDLRAFEKAEKVATVQQKAPLTVKMTSLPDLTVPAKTAARETPGLHSGSRSSSGPRQPTRSDPAALSPDRKSVTFSPQRRVMYVTISPDGRVAPGNQVRLSPGKVKVIAALGVGRGQQGTAAPPRGRTVASRRPGDNRVSDKTVTIIPRGVPNRGKSAQSGARLASPGRIPTGSAVTSSPRRATGSALVSPVRRRSPARVTCSDSGFARLPPSHVLRKLASPPRGGPTSATSGPSAVTTATTAARGVTTATAQRNATAATRVHDVTLTPPGTCVMSSGRNVSAAAGRGFVSTATTGSAQLVPAGGQHGAGRQPAGGATTAEQQPPPPGAPDACAVKRATPEGATQPEGVPELKRQRRH